jgi:hypothetical protein
LQKEVVTAGIVEIADDDATLGLRPVHVEIGIGERLMLLSEAARPVVQQNVMIAARCALQKNVVVVVAVEIANVRNVSAAAPCDTEVATCPRLMEYARLAATVVQRDTARLRRIFCDDQKIGSAVVVELARSQSVRVGCPCRCGGTEARR